MRLPDSLDHDKPEKQYDEAGLNAPQIVETVLKALRVNSAGVEEVRACKDRTVNDGKPRAGGEPDPGTGLIMAGTVFSGERSSRRRATAREDAAGLRSKDPSLESRGAGLSSTMATRPISVRCGRCCRPRHRFVDRRITDALLTRGASKVYAVDVGTNQLAWRLRGPRRRARGQTNARFLTEQVRRQSACRLRAASSLCRSWK